MAGNHEPPPVPPFPDPTNPTQMGRWMQWVVDRLDHLHTCVERKADEAMKRDTQREELQESRHQENQAGLSELKANLRPALMFIENANQSEVARTAVMKDRQDRVDRAKERRSRLVNMCREAVRVGAGAGVLTAVFEGVRALLGL